MCAMPLSADSSHDSISANRDGIVSHESGRAGRFHTARGKMRRSAALEPCPVRDADDAAGERNAELSELHPDPERDIPG